MDTVIGKWVKAEGGEEGMVVAVARAGGGTAGWQLLILQPNLRLITASAVKPVASVALARLIALADPIVPCATWLRCENVGPAEQGANGGKGSGGGR